MLPTFLMAALFLSGSSAAQATNGEPAALAFPMEFISRSGTWTDPLFDGGGSILSSYLLDCSACLPSIELSARVGPRWVQDQRFLRVNGAFTAGYSGGDPVTEYTYNIVTAQTLTLQYGRFLQHEPKSNSVGYIAGCIGSGYSQRGETKQPTVNDIEVHGDRGSEAHVLVGIEAGKMKSEKMGLYGGLELHFVRYNENKIVCLTCDREKEINAYVGLQFAKPR
jgi:hypothetical protein